MIEAPTSSDKPPRCSLPGSEHSPFADLTPRKREVLDHIARGLSNDEIAGRLFISAKTVRNHITHIFDLITIDQTR